MLVETVDFSSMSIRELRGIFRRYSPVKSQSDNFQQAFDATCLFAEKFPQSEQSQFLVRNFQAVHTYVASLCDSTLRDMTPFALLNAAIEEIKDQLRLSMYEGDFSGLQDEKERPCEWSSIGNGWRTNGAGAYWRYPSAHHLS